LNITDFKAGAFGQGNQYQYFSPSRITIGNDALRSQFVILKNERGQQKKFPNKDLTGFYDIKPIRLREQVKRNPKRVPPDFIFQLNEDEVERMVSQNAIPSRQVLGGTMPYVFTNQRVAAISAVLNSTRAIEVNILIIRALVAMRRFLIIDDTYLYHFGASLKDLGKKWFAFSKMEMGAIQMLEKLKKEKLV
jgi:hypothetical protein